MRNFIFFLAAFSFIAFIACSSASDSEPESTDTVFATVPDSLLAWRIDPEAMTMTRDFRDDSSLITVNRVINGLNAKYPQVELVYLDQRNDTVFTSVPDANYLGNQMGSAGATAWYADVAINLTSVPGINYVSIVMQPQSHAQSAVVGRSFYEGWKKQ